MGETPDQTRAEIAQLRSQMAERVIELRRAVERPVRIAKLAAAGSAAVVVAGAVALVASKVRERRDRKTIPARIAAVRSAAEGAPGEARKVAGGTTSRLRKDITKEIKAEMAHQRPFSQRMLEGAARAAAAAAVAAALKSLSDASEPGRKRPS